MIAWLRENAPVLEALGALLTALVAVAALIGVKLQIDASEKLAQAQSAREIYREFLTLSIANPTLADPGHCPNFSKSQDVAYGSYFEYLLYTAEQVTTMDPSWNTAFDDVLLGHLDVVCATDDWSGYSDAVQSILARTRAAQCSQVSACLAPSVSQ